LIVVTKEDLMYQWRDSLVNVLGIPPGKIGYLQAEQVDWQGKQFVLGMVQSLIIGGKYPPEMYKAFGLMVLDECHHMAADCFVRVCQSFPAKLRLGFSATPTRRDGKTKLLHWHVGPVMVRGTVLEAKAKVLVRQTGWCIPTYSNDGESETIPYKPGRMTLVNKAIAASEGRNLEIVNFVVQAYHSGRITLVMSDLRERHLDRLFQMLTNAGIPGEDIGYYVGGMSKIALGHTKQRKVVLGTYAMCATGTDVPAWDTLVMATPRSNVKQAIGRILRAVSGKKQPVIFDLVDKNSIFQGFHRARLKTYYSVGAQVVHV
jgi:superfamily II DNA or RNA helicase